MVLGGRLFGGGRRMVAPAQVSECLCVAGCVPALVAVDDLLPHGVWFGAVELELATVLSSSRPRIWRSLSAHGIAVSSRAPNTSSCCIEAS